MTRPEMELHGIQLPASIPDEVGYGCVDSTQSDLLVKLIRSKHYSVLCLCLDTTQCILYPILDLQDS